MKPRFLLDPGHVTSAVDGQLRYVGAADLARLHGVPLEACLVLPDGYDFDAAEERSRMLARAKRDGLPVLAPRADGAYPSLSPTPTPTKE